MSKGLSGFRIAAPKSFSLDSIDAGDRPASSGDKKTDEARLAQCVGGIGELQNMLYAESKKKLLVVLQGMDTAGKDGAINGVFSATHPLGMRAVAFKAPTPEEAAHDYLWRIHPHVPANGQIAVFNRSHYEDVVAARVLGIIDKAQAMTRCEQIVEFERYLTDNGTTVLKFFLHISKDEQKERLEARLTDPKKHWKFNPADLIERGRWGTNRTAYQDAIAATATDACPWWIVPANSKPHRNLMIATIVFEALQAMAPKYPALPVAYRDLKVE